MPSNHLTIKSRLEGVIEKESFYYILRFRAKTEPTLDQSIKLVLYWLLNSDRLLFIWEFQGNFKGLHRRLSSHFATVLGLEVSNSVLKYLFHDWYEYEPCRQEAVAPKDRCLHVESRHQFSYGRDLKEPVPTSLFRRFRNLVRREVIWREQFNSVS